MIDYVDVLQEYWEGLIGQELKKWDPASTLIGQSLGNETLHLPPLDSLWERAGAQGLLLLCLW